MIKTIYSAISGYLGGVLSTAIDGYLYLAGIPKKWIVSLQSSITYLTSVSSLQSCSAVLKSIQATLVAAQSSNAFNAVLSANILVSSTVKNNAVYGVQLKTTLVED